MGQIVRQPGGIERHLPKSEIVELASRNAREIIDSNQYDLLKVYIELKRYEVYLKSLIQDLKAPVLEKASEQQQKAFDYDNARVNISERTKWDFSVDNEWKELDEKIKGLTDLRKEREKYLKENNKVSATIDKETGEMMEEFELPKEIERGLSIRL